MPRRPEAAFDGVGSSGAPKLEEGAFVRIQGLKASPQLNGASGTCERWYPDSERWGVRLSCGQEKRVRPENLSVLAGAAAKIRPGSAVRLRGLKACPELNGAQGVVRDWLEGQSRWLVRLENGDEKRVRHENLEAADPGISVLGREDAAASLRRSYVAMARSSRPTDDGCDNFVVADAGPVAGAPAEARKPAAAASGGGAPAAAKKPAAAASGGGADAAAKKPVAAASGGGARATKAQERGGAARPPRGKGGEDGKSGKSFRLRQAVWTGAKGANLRPKQRQEPHEAAPEEASEGQACEAVDVAEGLHCPRWLWEALYKHQQDGVRWLWDLHQNKQGGILADDLGLGKTVQVVAYLASLHHSGHLKRLASPGSRSGVLVVCPVTLARQWQKELRVWYPRLDVRLLHQLDGKGRKEAFSSACSPQRVAITSYEMMRAAGSDIVEAPWAIVILDEGQKIRNPHGLGTLVAKRFNTPHRIILTGSPVHNNLQEMWSIMDFVRPGCLGTLPVFLEEIARPIEAGSAAGVKQARAATAYQMASALREIAKPAILRRTKLEVMEAIQLPKKEEQVLLCHLTLEQYAAYLGFLQSQQARQLRSGSREPGYLVHAVNICRRLCNHPDLLLGSHGNPDESSKIPDMWSCERSGKMKVLAEAMRQWKEEGHRVLVFVQTTQMLQVLQKWMDQQGYRHSRMDGRTPVNKRVQTIEEFNADTTLFAMVLTTRIGGVGLNIIGADRVVLYDPDWNPMTDIQARERAWRIGQRRDVAVYRLLLSGTLEEKIYQRQMAKQQLSQQVLSDGGQGQAFGKFRLMDAFALPPPPPGDHGEALLELKEKYKCLFQSLRPQEDPDELQQSSADIVQAITDLGGDKPATGGEAAGDSSGNSALLQTLFDRQGIRASFDGDSVERLLVDRKTVREGASALAAKAVAALQRSSSARADHGINEPTWTGRQGVVGAPAGFAERQAQAAASSCAATGASGGRPLKRSRGPSADVMAGVERLARKRPFPEPHRELAEAIFTAFLDKEFAGPEHALSTSQVLDNVGAHVPAERHGAFKSLLHRTCVFTKAQGSEEQGRWSLRTEFWPRDERKAAAKAEK